MKKTNKPSVVKVATFRNLPRAVFDLYKARCALEDITMRDDILRYMRGKIKGTNGSK